MWTIHDAPSDRDYQEQLNPPEPEEEEDVSKHNGAGRSTRKPLYHLVPIELMRVVAETRAHGDLKYEPGDWMKGDAAWFIDCLEHAIEHLIKTGSAANVPSMRLHLGHAATNIAFVLWALKREIVTPEDFAQAAVIMQEK